MTRGEWYAQHRGGGWRTARKPRKCDRSTPLGKCLTVTEAGQRYFDTNMLNHSNRRATIGICEACANEELKP